MVRVILMYAFIHIPKTGGSTFRHMLRCSFGPRHLDIKAPLHKREDHQWISADDLRRSRRIYPRLQGICGHRVTSFNRLEDAAPNIRYFTFVREPVARLVSHFQHHQRSLASADRRGDFLRFCEDPHQRNVLCRWIGGSESSTDAIAELDARIGFVGRTEDFEVSVVLFRRWLNLPALQIAHAPRNVRPNECALDLEEDEELFAAARDATAEDLLLHQEIVARIYPAQIETYGPTLAADVEQLQRDNEGYQDPGEPALARFKRNLLYKPLLHLRLA